MTIKNKNKLQTISDCFLELPAKIDFKNALGGNSKIWNVKQNVIGKIPPNNTFKKELNEMFPVFGEGKSDTRIVSWSDRKDQPRWHVCHFIEDIVTPDGYVGMYVSGYGETLDEAYQEYLKESAYPIYVDFEEFEKRVMEKEEDVTIALNERLNSGDNSHYVGMSAFRDVFPEYGKTIVKMKSGKELEAADVGVAIVFGKNRTELLYEEAKDALDYISKG